MSSTTSVAASASSPNLRSITLGVAPVSVAVQVCSFVSSIALARVLGASAATDAYFLGLSIPVVAYAILLAAVRLGAIPALTDVAADSSASFSRAASELVSVVGAAAILLAVVTTSIGTVALPLVVGDPRVASMTRWTVIELAPLAVTGAVTGALGAILAVRGRFVAAVAVMAIEPILKTALTFGFGHTIGINALIIGNLIGSAAAAGFLWALVRREGVDLRLTRAFDSKFLRALAVLSAPLVISQSVLQVNPLIDRAMASSLLSGTVTSLELGLRLFVVPTTLLTATLIGPIAATWAARRAEGGWDALRASASRAIETIAVAVPPCVVIGVALRHELISFVYRGGAYGGHALSDTAAVFGMLLLGLPAQALAIVYSTLYIVEKDAIFPMKIAAANVLLNVGLNFALRPVLGVAGIALSTSLTFSILVGVYALNANRRWGSITEESSRALVLRAGAGTASAVVVVGAASAVLPDPGSRGMLALALAGVGAAGLLAYSLFFIGSRGAANAVVARVAERGRREQPQS